jgi:hypothetical protein
MARHMASRKGERLRRLQEGHGHAEKLFLQQVWWPAFGHFNQLHPEYEVYDFKDGSRFLDFAFIRPMFHLAIEIDGNSTHGRDLGRRQFADQLLRQNHLVIDGWRVLRFAYDYVNERPRLCQQMLQQMFGRWLGEERSVTGADPAEHEIARLALRLCRPIKASDVCRNLGVESKYARRLLHRLVEKK